MRLMTHSHNKTEPPEWLRDWQRFCDDFRRDKALPLTDEQRQTAWRAFCDRLEQERLRRLFSPEQRRIDGSKVVPKLPLFPPQEGE